MPPTPLAITRTCTSSVESLVSASRSASALPCTSALMSTETTAGLGLAQLREHILGSRRLRGELDVAELALAVERDFARLALVLDHQQLVARVGRAGEAEHDDRHRGSAPRSTGCPLSSNIARTRPNSLPARIAVARLAACRCLTSTVATAPRPFSMLDSITTPAAGPSRGALSSSTSACSRIASSSWSMPAPVRAETLTNMFCAAPLLGDHLVLGELGAHALGIGVGFVDLVDRDDDRHAGRLGVLDGLDGLRHDAVVGGDHQHHDVGDLRAARAHRGEGRVARRVEEGDRRRAASRRGRRRCAA